jgi:hypothetical protein
MIPLTPPLDATIPYSYIGRFNKPFLVYLKLIDLDSLDCFISKIVKFIPVNSLFVVFIKLRYSNNSFIMCGNQFGFDYKNTDLERLLYIIKDKIADSFETYNMMDDVVYIQLSFRKVDSKLLSDFQIDKLDDNSKMSHTDYNTIVSNKNITVSTNEFSLGSPLKVDLSNDNITCIYLTLGNETINFIDRIVNNAKLLTPKHLDNIISFDKSYKFYLLSYFKSSYVLAVK